MTETARYAFNVGDRVVEEGFGFRGDLARYGVVNRVYEGAPDGQNRRPEFVSVVWENGTTSHGYLRASTLLKLVVIVPTAITST